MSKSGSIFFTFIICVSFFLSSTADAKVITGYTFQQWGRETLTQVENNFGRSDGLYKQSLTQTFPAYVWGQGITLSALVAAAKVDSSYLARAKSHAEALQDQFWCYSGGIWGYNASANSCGDRYYDDNAWIALGLMELYEITKDTTYLSHAREVVAFSMSGENSLQDTPDGGIRWHESNTEGASVCSTAPTCLANLLIYRATGIESYNTDGRRLYHWLMNSDLRYSSGIFHETNQGPLGYQTAVVTQAAVRLYQITADAGYLQDAQWMAAAMEHEFINKDTHVLGQTGKWGGHDMTNAYVELYEVDHNPHWLNIAAGYLEFLHEYCKDAATGRYPTSWNSTSSSPSTELIDNTSVARAYWKIAGTPGGAAPVYLNIKNRSSNRCLRLYESQTADNAPVVLYDQQPTYTSEMFTVVDLGNGYFNIRSWKADKSLQPYNNNSADNTNVVIDGANTSLPSQQWSLIDLGNGYFNIKNRLTGKSLRPLNSGTANNTNVVIYTTDTSQSSQQWQFVNTHVPTSITLYLLTNGSTWQQADRTILNPGDALSLKAQASGTGTWNWEGPDGFSATANEITVQNLQPDQSGYYIAKYTNENGIESCSAFHVSVVSHVKLYQHCNYSGWEVRLGAGAYTASDLIAAGGLNKDASSAKIDPGYTVTFYDKDNFQGASLVKTGDDTCFVDDGWNDRIASLIVEPDAEPIAYWTFNEANGSVVYEASNNNYDGTLMNMDAANRVLGKQCGAVSLNGIDDYILIPAFKGITGSASRTCAAWIKTSQISGELFTWGDSKIGGKWIVRVNETGSLRAEVQNGYIYGTHPVNDGNWHHIAVVLEDDESADISEVFLYIDGHRDTIAGVSPRAINTSIAQDVRIGVFYVGQRYFQGLIDDVRIYNRALTGAEIREMYKSLALTGDTEPDGDIDLNDFAVLANSWQSSNSCDADLTCDCIVDINDFIILAEGWLNQIPQ